VFHNKQDEQGVVTRNKARLKTKGYSQVEGLNFDENLLLYLGLSQFVFYLPMLLTMILSFFQIDVKSAFLNGPIKQEVYVEQPLGFQDKEYPNHVYKLHKVLYGLKHAPRA
jgi:hypothetical protein